MWRATPRCSMQHRGISFYIWRMLGMTIAGGGVSSESVDVEGRSCSFDLGRTENPDRTRLGVPAGANHSFPFAS